MKILRELDPPENKTEKEVREFFMQDEISMVCPDKDKVGVRYRLGDLNQLYLKFNENSINTISYPQFTRYVPGNIVKPKAEDWGTCLCKPCHNPELKVEAWNRLVNAGKVKEAINLQKLTSLSKDDLTNFFDTMPDNNCMVTYLEWQKEAVVTTKKRKVSKQPNKPAEATAEPAVAKTYRSVKNQLVKPMKEFISLLRDEVLFLQQHEVRQISQFRRIKEVKKYVSDPANKAIALRIDWSENETLFQVSTRLCVPEVCLI